MLMLMCVWKAEEVVVCLAVCHSYHVPMTGCLTDRVSLELAVSQQAPVSSCLFPDFPSLR